MQGKTDDVVLDCIIIGGGPAGLTAAVYLARFRRNICVYDTNNSRALLIPRSHNYPGFAEGIPGPMILQRLKQQLAVYQVPVINEEVQQITRDQDLFIIHSQTGKKIARNVLLATGVQDLEPALPNLIDGIRQGLIRHCPVCDAFEVIDKKIAVIGEGKSGLEQALFLMDYSQNVSLVTLGKVTQWSKKDQQKINQSKLTVIDSKVTAIQLLTDHAKISFADNNTIQFDCLYSALGCVKNNDLAVNLDAKLKNGLLVVNKKQQTSVKGLYAAGDIVSSLHQLCVAEGQAAIAATAIHHRCKSNSKNQR